MTRQQQIWLSSACFILLILLTGCVWFGYTNGLDNQVRGFALGLFPPGNERIWSDITFLGSGMVITTLTVLALTILGLQKKWREIRYLIFVVAAAGATEVSMKWFSMSDTYGVEIADGEDDVLILAATVVIDMVCHDDKRH